VEEVSNSGTRTKFAMKFYRALIVIICACLLPGNLSAQSAATTRLMELINSGDMDSVEDKLLHAAIITIRDREQIRAFPEPTSQR
jgi:hypothetical protein